MPRRGQPGHSQAGSTRTGKTTGKQEKTNPKVLSSHNMGGRKIPSHPSTQPIHLCLPLTSIREAAGVGM